jgi:catechol 2,3-dioxygenase-like lactoylglutathione lyase family enzyme
MTALGQLDHIDIVVAEPQVMAHYLESLGFTRIREIAGGRGSIELRFPGAGDQPFIELTPQTALDGSLRPLGLRHMALRAGDLDAEYSSLVAAGFTTDSPPREIAQTGRRLFNLKDPEGNVLQVVSTPSE